MASGTDDDYDEYDSDGFEDGEDSTLLVSTEQPEAEDADPLGHDDLNRLDPQTRTLTHEAKDCYGEQSEENILTGADAELAVDSSSSSPESALPNSSLTVESKLGMPSSLVLSNTTAEAGTVDHEETVAKLRVANSALRYQLKEFSRALDASLQTTGRASSAGSGFKAAQESRRGGRDVSKDARQSLRAMLQTKTKMYENAKKKLDIYKTTNAELKRQLREAYNSDRLAQMNNENADKEREIQKLIEENRSLVNMQRNQAREIERAETNRDEYPARIASLGEDLRVAREKLRVLREKARKAETHQKKQHAQLMSLIDKNKALNSEVKRYEKSGGKAKSKAQMEAESKTKMWADEKAKLIKKITLLEKKNGQDRSKANQTIKKANAEMKRGKEALQRLKARLEGKEREMRMQVLQVKKLKRHLREIALGGAPLPTGPAPWAQNMAGYNSKEKDDDEGDIEHLSDFSQHSPHEQDSSFAGKPFPPAEVYPHRQESRPQRHLEGNGALSEEKRRVEEEEARRREWNEAASRVQASYRGRIGRKRARQHHDEHHSAVMLQAVQRGVAERRRHNIRLLVHREKENMQQNTAATKLQSQFRGHSARKIAKERREKRESKSENTEDYGDDDFEEEPEAKSSPPPIKVSTSKANAFAKPSMRKKKKKNYF